MKKLLSAGLGFIICMVGMVYASPIYVHATDPVVENQLKMLVKQIGGVADGPSAYYSLTVTTDGGADNSNHRLSANFTGKDKPIAGFVAGINDLSPNAQLQALVAHSDKLIAWIEQAEHSPAPSLSSVAPAPSASGALPPLTPTNFSPPSASLAAPITAAEAPSEATTATGVPIAFTGLIVDTLGFKISRGMSPKIYDETGRLVYGLVNDENVDQAMKVGVVGYANDFAAAVNNPRIGKHPLVVHAVNANANPGNAFPKDVVITQKDADMILQANSTQRFLDRFGVVFLVDPGNL